MNLKIASINLFIRHRQAVPVALLALRGAKAKPGPVLAGVRMPHPAIGRLARWRRRKAAEPEQSRQSGLVPSAHGALGRVPLVA